MKKQNQRRPSVRRRQAAKAPAAPHGLERLFTIGQIAQLGGPCRAKLYGDIKSGRLKAIKFGRSTRISEGAYRSYLESAPTL
jgi:hypothetical protein